MPRRRQSPGPRQTAHGAWRAGAVEMACLGQVGSPNVARHLDPDGGGGPTPREEPGARTLTRISLVTVWHRPRQWDERACPRRGEGFVPRHIGNQTTTKVNCAEILAAKLPSPVYLAVRWCVPRASSVERRPFCLVVCPGMRVSTAVPEASSVAKPITLLPSEKMIVPVGAPAPAKAGVTFTVRVSSLPAGAGLAEAVKTVVVAAWLTVSWSTALRLG